MNRRCTADRAIKIRRFKHDLKMRRAELAAKVIKMIKTRMAERHRVEREWTRKTAKWKASHPGFRGDVTIILEGAEGRCGHLRFPNAGVRRAKKGHLVVITEHHGVYAFSTDEVDTIAIRSYAKGATPYSKPTITYRPWEVPR